MMVYGHAERIAGEVRGSRVRPERLRWTDLGGRRARACLKMVEAESVQGAFALGKRTATTSRPANRATLKSCCGRLLPEKAGNSLLRQRCIDSEIATRMLPARLPA